MIWLLLLLAAVVVVVLLFAILRAIWPLFLNSVLGLIIIFTCNHLFSLGIDYTWIVVLVCAIGGIPGALLVILLHLLGIVF